MAQFVRIPRIHDQLAVITRVIQGRVASGRHARGLVAMKLTWLRAGWVHPNKGTKRDIDVATCNHLGIGLHPPVLAWRDSGRTPPSGKPGLCSTWWPLSALA